jgi:hypothetical protein
VQGSDRIRHFATTRYLPVPFRFTEGDPDGIQECLSFFPSLKGTGANDGECAANNDLPHM